MKHASMVLAALVFAAVAQPSLAGFAEASTVQVPDSTSMQDERLAPFAVFEVQPSGVFAGGASEPAANDHAPATHASIGHRAGESLAMHGRTYVAEVDGWPD